MDWLMILSPLSRAKSQIASETWWLKTTILLYLLILWVKGWEELSREILWLQVALTDVIHWHPTSGWTALEGPERLAHISDPLVKMAKGCQEQPEARRKPWKRLFPGAFGRIVVLSTTWFQTSSLWNYKGINFYSLKLPVYGNFLKAAQGN